VREESPSVALQGALEVSVRTFRDLGTEQWPTWITYLLERLERERPEEIEAVLRNVKRNIETRLALRRW
jgi:hypothetical protein